MPVFRALNGWVYLADNPASPSDCIIPGPSPMMVDVLTAAQGKMVDPATISTAMGIYGNGAGSQYTNTGMS